MYSGKFYGIPCPSDLLLGRGTGIVSLHSYNLEEQVSIVSRVGNDCLGKEALRRISSKGLLNDLVQVDNNYETGFVMVELDDKPGVPNYKIIESVSAWDFIELSDFIYMNVLKMPGESFSAVWLNAIKRLADSIKELLKSKCHKIFDINLRPPYVTKQIIEESLMAADILKINDDELHQLAEWFDLPDSQEDAIRILSQKFNCPVITVTKSSNGAILLYDNECFSHPGFKVKVADTVGAGDAFLAALIVGIKSGKRGRISSNLQMRPEHMLLHRVVPFQATMSATSGRFMNRI